MYYEKRVTVLYCVIILAVSFLAFRLYNLSKPETNKSMSVLEGQYSSEIDVCEKGGFVYDRNMELLSHKFVGKTALVNPSVCRNAKMYSESLAKYAVSSDTEDIFERINDGIPFTTALSCQADTTRLMSLDGVYVFDVYEENNSIAKHLLGYNNSDGIGVSGLRKEYDELLNLALFSRVSATFESNAKNVSMSPFHLECAEYEKTDGVVTTLDKNLQMLCDGMSDKIQSGAIVVADCTKGEILAMSSFPDYEAERIADVLDSDKGELVNRALQSFTPGSVFKIIMVAAALERDSSLWDLKYTCSGSVEIDKDVFNCHKHDGHGEQTMEEAFANSCNTYFINLGMIIGLDTIAQTMKKLGLDGMSKADFLCESKNYFLDENNNSLGYLANISFGQGDLCLSPLDMISVLSSVSTGCKKDLSVMLADVKNGRMMGRKQAKSERIFSQNAVDKMLIMMEKCITSGTGRNAYINGVEIGGKTATAQTGRFNDAGVEYVHKWFCGVYPVDDPKFSICILCDFSTENVLSPALIFKEICVYLDENGF